jgi:hypothetical protein
MSESAPRTQRTNPRRRRLQFSLATLLILFTVLGVWLGLWTHSARQQQRAVEALRATGAVTIYYDCDLDERGYLLVARPDNLWRWFETLIGIDYVHTVKWVIIGGGRRGSSFGDEDLAHLQSLPAVEHVRIVQARIEGDGLRYLKPLSRLKELHIIETPVTDACLVHVIQLTSLEILGLIDTEITDDGLLKLQGLRNLRVLHVDRKYWTKPGIQALKKALPGLTLGKE